MAATRMAKTISSVALAKKSWIETLAGLQNRGPKLEVWALTGLSPQSA
jgi:hypothetical protein